MKKIQTNIEIEARFLNIDVDKIKSKLSLLNASDLHETILKEIIFYDSSLDWRKEAKFVRLRNSNGASYLSYKHHKKSTVDGTEEIELQIDDYKKAKQFLEKVGLRAFREQEKKRHSYKVGNVSVEIDTWPKLPPYLEIEADSVTDVRKVAKSLGLKWSNAIFEDAKIIIEKYYNIPVSKLKYFTFDKIL